MSQTHPRKNASEYFRPRWSARRLGQDEHYLIVEILSEASTIVLRWRDYHPSEAIFAGLGLQHWGNV
jgi:hypothetical protein